MNGWRRWQATLAGRLAGAIARWVNLQVSPNAPFLAQPWLNGFLAGGIGRLCWQVDKLVPWLFGQTSEECSTPMT